MPQRRSGPLLSSRNRRGRSALSTTLCIMQPARQQPRPTRAEGAGADRGMAWAGRTPRLFSWTL